jgi:20S proteasome alpha/beta subunit
MAGRNSVAIAIDARFGLGFQTISNSDMSGGSSSRITLLPGSKTLMAWTGLYGDGISFAEEMNISLARKLRKSSCMGFDSDIIATSKTMSPRAIAMFTSHLLYRRRNSPYYVEPVIVGLESVEVPVYSDDGETADKEKMLAVDDTIGQLQAIAASYTQQKLTPSYDNTAIHAQVEHPKRYRTIQRPYLCSTDMLGARSTSSTFACSGVASRSLHGTAEALWRPNLEAEELVEVCGKAFLSALERDCLSGYGAVIYLIQSETDDGEECDNVCIKEYILACRND